MANTNGDSMVRATQVWLNRTYGNDSRFNVIPESLYGKASWTTIYALVRALQIELGIQQTSNNFGPTTQRLYTTQKKEFGVCRNIYGIIQGALWCKGYSTGHYGVLIDGEYVIDTSYDDKVENAVKKLEKDAGRATQTGEVDLNLMMSLLSMDSFVLVSGGDTMIREIQQYLNKNYESYIGLKACDGVYGRNTNKALIYALQAEEGLPSSTANGNFGPSTKKYCPTIPYDQVATNNKGQKYLLESISNFIKILQGGLYCNGYEIPGLSGILDDTTQNAIRNFRDDYGLPAGSSMDLTGWLSLLLSCGDVNRSCLACDTATRLDSAKAQTLIDNGYKYVGRYLTKVEGGLDKNMTRTEINVLHKKGLSIFPIFQEDGRSADKFTSETGTINAKKARKAAEDLGIPYGTTLYFAVDFDPQQDVIYSNIYPYFQSIYNFFAKKGTYNIGVYGTRNVCRILKSKEERDVFGIDNLFVSDSSSGFSGNLGFSLPKEWAFDQYAVDITIGTGDGRVSIDKVAYSGKDKGFSKIIYDSVENVYSNLGLLYDLAMEYTNNNQQRSNQLVLQYIRKGIYGDESIFSGDTDSGNSILWSAVAGNIDKNYCDLVDKTYDNLIFNFRDEKTGYMHDLSHLAAALNAILWEIQTDNLKPYSKELEAFAGWAGDTLSFAKTIKNVVKDDEDIPTFANLNIATQEYGRYFNLVDYIDDLDAVNLGNLILKNNYSLLEAFNQYYGTKNMDTNKYDYEIREKKFIESIGREKFEDLCERINSKDLNNDLIICICRKYLAGIETEQKYIDAAIIAFKNRVYSNENK